MVEFDEAIGADGGAGGVETMIIAHAHHGCGVVHSIRKSEDVADCPPFVANHRLDVQHLQQGTLELVAMEYVGNSVFG